MGWAWFALLAAATFVLLLWAARAVRGRGQLIAAAVAIAGAGYAWQGRPALPGAPAPPPRTANEGGESLFARERGAFLEKVGRDAQLLDSADAFIANGDAAYAIGILRGELSRRPDRAMLWLGLGNALAAYAEGSLTPPARYAFARAVALAPDNPAPRYFLGLALAEAGELEPAEAVLRSLLAASPSGAPWRGRVEEKLIQIGMIRQMVTQAP